MRVVFYQYANRRFDRAIWKSLRCGIIAHGDTVELRPSVDYRRPVGTADVAIVVGVDHPAKQIMQDYIGLGRHAVIFDKGYTRIHGGPIGTVYWRVSVDALQPHAYFMKTPRGSERWKALGLPLQGADGRTDGRVIFCGGSPRYCDWHNLGTPTAYAAEVLTQLRAHTNRPLVYRPKPSWAKSVTVEMPRPDVGYSPPRHEFIDELPNTYMVVTYGSNAAFEAVIHGVPAMVLGDGIARHLAVTTVADIDNPLRPTLAEVRRLAYAVSYCQWTLDEMADGSCWASVRPLLES